jgi:hypothetical protein
MRDVEELARLDPICEEQAVGQRGGQLAAQRINDVLMLRDADGWEEVREGVGGRRELGDGRLSERCGCLRLMTVC